MRKTVCLYSPNGGTQVYENCTQVECATYGVQFVNGDGEQIDTNLQYKVITNPKKR